MTRNRILAYASVSILAATVAFAASSAPPAPPAPKAPVAAPAAAAPRAPVAPNTVSRSGRYDAKRIEISDVYGNLSVKVGAGGPISLQIAAPKTVLDTVRVSADGGVLRITEERPGHVWNWREWFEFKRQKRERVSLNLIAPKGTALKVNDFVGEFSIGDLQSQVEIGAAAARGTVGNVQSARIELAGSGNIDVGTVSEQLKIEIAGSGSVKTGASAGASVEIAGSGDARLGPVLGGLKVEIAGSGDVDVASVNGPTSIETAGAGSIKIATGEANPLKVEILGSGNFVFGGEAVDPKITALGSGDVSLASYRGKLSTEGMTHVKVGLKTVVIDRMGHDHDESDNDNND